MQKPKKNKNYFALIYFSAHVLVGLLIEILPLNTYQWLRTFFVKIDSFSPTFRTWFVWSNDPLGCKVMLFLWWVIFIPWGLFWIGRNTSGFIGLDNKIIKGIWPRVKFLMIGFFFPIVLTYGHLFMDQTENMAAASLKYGRISIVPFLINNGPAYFSLYLVVMSLLYVLSCAFLFALLRDLFSQFKFLKRNI